MSWQESIADLLATRIGLDVSSVGTGVIEGAVRRRMEATAADSPTAYVASLADSPAEQSGLIEEVVVPESWFFRDGRPFRRLQEYVRANRKDHRALRILSIPCAGGEEPYSIAIALREIDLPADRVHIDAVDISARALERARQGVYGAHAFRGADFGDSRRYFRSHPAGLELEPDVRAMVTFREGNLLNARLLADAPAYDAIFCRNLLIYLTDQARRRAVAALDRLLAEGGILFVGHAEALSLLQPRFAPDGDRGSFAYRRAAPVPPPAPAQLLNRPRLNLVARTFADRKAADPHEIRVAPAPQAIPQVQVAAPSPDALLDRATEHANRQEHDEAVRLCERALYLHGPAARAFLLLGMIDLARGRPEQAEVNLLKAVYLDGQEDEGLLALALICERRGDRDGAARFQHRAERARRMKEAP